MKNFNKEDIKRFEKRSRSIFHQEITLPCQLTSVKRADRLNSLALLTNPEETSRVDPLYLSSICSSGHPVFIFLS
jgi:hypothetical protein